MEIGFSKEKLHVLQFRYPEVPKDLGKEILTAACPGLRVSDDFFGHFVLVAGNQEGSFWNL